MKNWRDVEHEEVTEMINEAKRHRDTPNPVGGFTCQCGTWVPYGTSHSCFTQAVLPQTNYNPYPFGFPIDLTPVVEELRKIREVFERMEKKEYS